MDYETKGYKFMTKKVIEGEVWVKKSSIKTLDREAVADLLGEELPWLRCDLESLADKICQLFEGE